MEAAAANVRRLLENPQHVTIRHVIKPLLLLGILAGGAVYWIVSTLRVIHSNRLLRRRARHGAVPPAAIALRWVRCLFSSRPATLLYTAFVIVPSVRSVTWSLHEWNGLGPMTWVGLLHFKRLLFEDDLFWIALGNNLFIMFVDPRVRAADLDVPGRLHQPGLWGSNVFRIAFFLPNIIGGVAATLVWLHLYNPRGGPVNALLVAMGFSGFEGFPWLSQQNLYWALVPMSIWAACGFNMLLFLAAMQSIPGELYEAADLDGATPWQQFWTVTLPSIWPPSACRSCCW